MGLVDDNGRKGGNARRLPTGKVEWVVGRDGKDAIAKEGESFSFLYGQFVTFGNGNCVLFAAGVLKEVGRW